MEEITCFVHPPPTLLFCTPSPHPTGLYTLPHSTVLHALPPPYWFVHPPPTLLFCTPSPHPTVLYTLPPPYCFVHPPPTLLFCTPSPSTLYSGKVLSSVPPYAWLYLLVANRFEYRHFNPHKSAVVK